MDFSDIDFQNCTKCLPPSILPMMSEKKLLPCETNEDLKCAFDITHEKYKTMKKLYSCPLPCTILQYSGKVEFWDPKYTYGAVYQNNRRVSEQLIIQRFQVDRGQFGVQGFGLGLGHHLGYSNVSPKTFRNMTHYSDNRLFLLVLYFTGDLIHQN